MMLKEVREALASSLDAPIDKKRVVEDHGDTELRAPTGETETIEEVLEREDVDSYRSVNELVESIEGNVCEDFVGRKHYDDRGPNPGTREHESF